MSRVTCAGSLLEVVPWHSRYIACPYCRRYIEAKPYRHPDGQPHWMLGQHFQEQAPRRESGPWMAFGCSAAEPAYPDVADFCDLTEDFAGTDVDINRCTAMSATWEPAKEEP